MFRRHFAVFSLVGACLIAILPGRTAAASQPITVALASGRTFQGELDGHTDDRQLVLRFVSGGITVLRPILWERVVEVQFQGGAYPGGMFRQLVQQARPAPEHPSSMKVARLTIARKPVVSSSHTKPAPPPAVTPRVESLHIEAYPANWDGDVEVDGLLLRVFPLDAVGQVLPAAGALEVDLLGEELAQGPGGFPRIGRWTFAVTPEMFADGATLRLPFQAVHPEFDAALGPRALVHARLAVPGDGVFDASAPAVRLRPYSSLRDRAQQTQGDRFFPVERTGR